MNDTNDRPHGESRRSFLLRSAAGAGSLWLVSEWPRTVDAQDRLVTPSWEAVPACAASKTDGAGQGPFFIHNRERDDDVDLFRQDIRGRYHQDAEPGTDMQLHLQILNTADCATPVAGIDVYVWHTTPRVITAVSASQVSRRRTSSTPAGPAAMISTPASASVGGPASPTRMASYPFAAFFPAGTTAATCTSTCWRSSPIRVARPTNLSRPRPHSHHPVLL